MPSPVVSLKKDSHGCPLFVGLVEITLQQTFKCLAVTSFITSHLMHGVMDRIQVCFFCTLGQVDLSGSCAVFRLHTHFQVLLRGRCYDLAQQFSELRSVLSFFPCGLLIICLLYTSPSPRDS